MPNGTYPQLLLPGCRGSLAGGWDGGEGGGGGMAAAGGCSLLERVWELSELRRREGRLRVRGVAWRGVAWHGSWIGHAGDNTVLGEVGRTNVAVRSGDWHALWRCVLSVATSFPDTHIYTPCMCVFVCAPQAGLAQAEAQLRDAERARDSAEAAAAEASQTARQAEVQGAGGGGQALEHVEHAS